MIASVDLADIGRYWARWQPDDIALRYEERSWTWAALDAGTDALAAGFAAIGVSRNDRVGVLMTNRPELIETLVAAWKLGAVGVPLNVRATPPELAYMVADAGCELVVTEEALAHGLTLVPEGRVLLAEALDEQRLDAPVPVLAIGADDPALICYTSGTTGDPKGALQSHGAWNAASQGWSQALGLRVDDRVLLPFPLAFTGGLAVWLMAYWTGARLVLEGAFDPGRALDVIEREGITGFLAVPVVIQSVVDHPRFADADLSTWRLAAAGGSPVPEALLRRVQDRGIPMLQGYALTEACGCATVLPASQALRKLGSAGLPVVHTEVTIMGVGMEPLPPGEVGEICLRGPQLMDGYWGRPEASIETIVDGWLRTGDLGTLDDEGFLTVVDRSKDMVISGGLNVYPAEVERVLATVAGIVEVAVIGVPDERWGETPAVVAYTAGAVVTGDDVLAACRGVLADYKQPRYLVVRDDPLPRTTSGKVRKGDLRAALADLPERATPIR